MEFSIIHIYLLYLLFVAPQFLYIGYMGHNVNKIFYTLLLSLGLLVLSYHSYKLYQNYNSNWGYHVNLIHILFVGPLLLYIGYKNTNVEYIYFDILNILGLGLLLHFFMKTMRYYKNN